MVALSSVSGAGASLYLEIRRIELQGGQQDVRYQLTGIVGDGCDEAMINVELGDPSRVEIVPFCDDDGSGGTLLERIDKAALSALILEALDRLYFCVEAAPGRRYSGKISGYAESGRLFRFPDRQSRPHCHAGIAEAVSNWSVA